MKIIYTKVITTSPNIGVRLITQADVTEDEFQDLASITPDNPRVGVNATWFVHGLQVQA
jgi:hypothetical protein